MIVGVILAGGESRRFHRNKLIVEVDGIPVVRRVYNALKENVDMVYLSVKDNSRINELSKYFLNEEVRYVLDFQDLGGGPYNAIISSLDKIEADEFLIVPGDTPWVTSVFFSRWMDKINEYRTAASTVIWGNGMLDSLYIYIDKKRIRNIVKLLYLMRKEGRATDIIRASPCILFAHVRDLVDDPILLAHINTRENLSNPSPKNPVEGFVDEDVVIRRPGISSIPFLKALDRVSSKDYREAVKILLEELMEYHEYEIYHLVYHVSKDIEDVIEFIM